MRTLVLQLKDGTKYEFDAGDNDMDYFLNVLLNSSFIYSDTLAVRCSDVCTLEIIDEEDE